MLKLSNIIKFIEKKNGIKLLDTQKDCLKHIVKGDIIYTPRCFGRSMLYEGYADYLKSEIAKTTDYSVESDDFDIVYKSTDVANTFIPKDRMEEMRQNNLKNFEKEFECKYKV